VCFWLRELWEKTAGEGGQGMAITHAEVDRILMDLAELTTAEQVFYEPLKQT